MHPVLLLVFLAASGSAAQGSGAQHLRMMVPLDTGSRAAWTAVLQGAPAVGMVVLNPDSGPGPSANATAAALVAQAQREGIKVVGYVATAYARGNVSLDAIELQVDDYLGWYGVDGIFFDQSNSSCAQAPSGFYGALGTFVKARSPSLLVVLNPGTAPGPCYMQASDLIVSFEDTFQHYASGYAPAAWTQSSPSGRFCNLVLGTPDGASMREAVDLAVSRNVGWVFVTSWTTAQGNPYSSLPPYFSEEVAYIDSLDGRGAGQSAQPVIIGVAMILAGVAVAFTLRRL